MPVSETNLFIGHETQELPCGEVLIDHSVAEILLTRSGWHIEPGYVVEESHVDENGVTVYDKIHVYEFSIVADKE